MDYRIIMHAVSARVREKHESEGAKESSSSFLSASLRVSGFPTKLALTEQSFWRFYSVEKALNHPINEILQKPKPQQYNLRRTVCLRPKINTERFKNTFVNRLIFEHNLL